MLYTKSILEERKPEDGLRISVMSRHTLNDGLTLDARITNNHFDEHLQILAPPLKIIGEYLRGELDWENYIAKYLEYLKKPDIAKEVKQLAERATKQDITLLCIEDTPNYCHRRLLAEECQRYQPLLQVICR